MYNKLQTSTAPAPLPVQENLVSIYNKIRHNSLFLNLTIVVAYLLLTIVVTWPILPNFDKQVTETGDPFFISWVVGSETWSLRTGDFANFWNQNIFYPYPNTLALSDHSLTLTLQALPTYLITGNPIVTINTLVLLSFFLSALFACFLIYYYTGSRKAAFIGGIVYGFSTYHVTQLDHLQIISYQYIPLTLLFFEKLLKTPNWKNAVFFALAFTLNAFVSSYLLGFIIIPLTIILVLRLISHEVILNKKFLLNFLVAGILTAALVVPWLLPYLEVGQDFNVFHVAGEYYGYSAHPGDFLLANKNNWLMSGYINQIKASDPLASWNERTLYVGFFTVVLALFGVFSRDRIKKRFVETPNSAIWFTILLVGLALSFGPVISLTNSNQSPVYGPYIILWQFLSIYKGIRVPSRIMVIVVLALAVLIGFTAKKVEAFRPGKKQLAYAAFGLILLFEQGSFPLKLLTPIPVNTALYDWTAANLAKDAVLVHYPFNNFDVGMGYLRGSLIDHKRTLNGYSSFTPESILRLEARAQTDPDSFMKVCATLGIKYLVVHGDYITPEDSLALSIKEKKMAPLATIGKDSVYDIGSNKDATFYNTTTIYASVLENDRLTVDDKNNTSSIFVSPHLEKINVQVTFFKGENRVGENKLSFYKPLYLMPGETSSASLEISPPLFGYDSMTLDIK